jgi:anti-sigma factor RsiW
MSASADRHERAPTSDELLAMAYADGELDGAELAAFEARLAREPALGREVAGLLKLHILAREVAPSEPEDFEWARISRSPSRRFLLSLVWIFVLVDVALLLGYGLYAFLGAGAPLLVKVAVVLGLAAFVIWFGLVARARLRTLPYDPYAEIKR